MPLSMTNVIKALIWLAFIVVGVLVVRYGSELIFYVPGEIAKELSFALTGSSKGVVANLLFYLVAAFFVLAIVAAGWGAIQIDNWLASRRRG